MQKIQKKTAPTDAGGNEIRTNNLLAAGVLGGNNVMLNSALAFRMPVFSGNDICSNKNLSTNFSSSVSTCKVCNDAISVNSLEQRNGEFKHFGKVFYKPLASVLRSAVYRLFLLFAVLFLMTSCNDEGVIVLDDYIVYPVNMPYEILYNDADYNPLDSSYVPFPCKWINLVYHDTQDSKFPNFVWAENLTVINSNEELENYLECSEESDFPEIDFSNHTLLLANFIFPAATAQRLKGLQQISKNNYIINLEKVPWGQDIVAYMVIALIVNKLSEESNVELNITIKNTLEGD